MASILEQLPPGARVAVIRLRSLGDCVLLTPALEILKRARPDLRVTVVVEEAFAEVFEGNPDVDALLPPRLRAVKGFSPELCLNLHGGTRSLRLTAFSGARFRAGFGHFRFGFVHNVKIPRAQEILGEERKVHTAEHMASAMFYLGAPRVEIPRARLFVDPGAPLFGPPYAVIHPLASEPAKTWPAEKFLALARQLPMRCVFIAGAGQNLSAFKEHRTLAGESIHQIKRLLQRATLFVGNDSGPAHMAAALGIPTVVIFGKSDPVIWGPWKAPAETVVARGPISGISVDEVQGAIERLGVPA